MRPRGCYWHGSRRGLPTVHGTRGNWDTVLGCHGGSVPGHGPCPWMVYGGRGYPGGALPPLWMEYGCRGNHGNQPAGLDFRGGSQVD